MRRPLARLALLLAAIQISVVHARGQAGDPPVSETQSRVVLIGDSIRMGYASRAAERLKGRAVVIQPKENGGDSGNVLRNLDRWVIAQKPDIVHLNCGLHDLKRFKVDGHYQVSISEYEKNLRAIVGRIRKETAARIIFATTTPIIDDRHARRKADFDRHEADVESYNAVAIRLMRELEVTVHDLHWVVDRGGRGEMLVADGTHYTPAAYDRLSEAVTDSVSRQLAILRDARTKKPAPRMLSSAEYMASQAARDALVPPRFREMKVPPFPIPSGAATWKARRDDVRKKVLDSLGTLPDRPSPARSRVVTRELWPTFLLEKVAIDNGVDSEISALFLRPMNGEGPFPAILWLHSSSPDQNQILEPNTNGGETSLGEVFTKAGYAVLASNAYWHGERVGTGPSGAAETAVAEQSSLHKYNLLLGRTLWGMFVRDDQIALDYLCSRSEVSKSRIGATGISMGSTRAWWLAAVDERVAAVVGVACLTRIQNLVAHGELRAHGVYYFPFGMLKHFDTEGVLSLIAPRPFLALTGELDAGSPADGVKELGRIVGGIYRALGAESRFRSVLYPETGHVYTPAMRGEMLDWFDRWLKPEGR